MTWGHYYNVNIITVLSNIESLWIMKYHKYHVCVVPRVIPGRGGYEELLGLTLATAWSNKRLRQAKRPPFIQASSGGYATAAASNSLK